MEKRKVFSTDGAGPTQYMCVWGEGPQSHLIPYTQVLIQDGSQV